MTKPSYKVCLLTAGVGSRVGHFSDIINKGILPVDNKAVISHIIEKFPAEVEIVIAVGHKQDTVVDYLTLAYPERSFTFVEVDKYTGPGSGPGYSLLACKDKLQVPFIFCTADTIVLEDVPPPDQNWIGIASVRDTEPYCTVKIKNNLVYQLENKVKTDNKFAFIGLAGIHDYAEFFEALEQNEEIKENEFQMVDGFKGLLERRLAPIGFTWFDTGSETNYIETDKYLSGGGNKFDFSKSDEFLYFVNGRVLKFFSDEQIAKKRCYRARHGLKGLVPKIEGQRGHFYSYDMVPGQTLYSALTPKVTAEFLAWAEQNLWKPVTLDTAQQTEFVAACKDFYLTKTKKRLALYREKTENTEPAYINGVAVPQAQELIERVDWTRLTAGGIPSNFHGDLQFDNVLLSKTKTGESTFVLLDWRHEFGGSSDLGDVYYDLAKLYGGMILSYPLIKEGMFACETSDNQAFYHFFTKSDLSDAKDVYEAFLKKHDYDLEKVRTLTALIFLNMAPLHHAPFDVLLHCLGRTMLHKILTA